MKQNQESQNLVFSHILEELMKEREITYKKLSLETGIPKTTLFTWSTGSIPRNLHDLRKVADFFDVEIHYLLFGESDPKAIRPKKQVVRASFEIPLSEINLSRSLYQGASCLE